MNPDHTVTGFFLSAFIGVQIHRVIPRPCPPFRFNAEFPSLVPTTGPLQTTPLAGAVANYAPWPGPLQTTSYGRGGPNRFFPRIPNPSHNNLKLSYLPCLPPLPAISPPTPTPVSLAHELLLDRTYDCAATNRRFPP